MTTEEAAIGAIGALYAVLLSALGWAWKRTIGEQDRLRNDSERLSERLTRQEERTSRLMELESAVNSKMDLMIRDLGDIRERLARWESAPRG